MNKESTIIVLGTAHRLREPGKQSPDGRIKECVYSREIAGEIATKLIAMGYKAEVDYMPLDLPKSMQSPSVKLERSRELAMRANYVNELCRQNGAGNVLYVSIHLNAASADDKWHTGTGWEVITSQGKTKSDYLALCLFEAARKNLKGIKLRADYSDGDPDKESNLYVLTNTKCPAVLTENLFQDNKNDVEYLLSEEGRHNIVRTHIEGIIEYIEKA